MSKNVKIILALMKPDPIDLKGATKKQKYYIIKGFYESKRQKIMNWIFNKGLESDIIEVSESYMFNSLFITSKVDYKDLFKTAPGVEDASYNEDVSLELI